MLDTVGGMRLAAGTLLVWPVLRACQRIGLATIGPAMIREDHDGYTVFRETPEELADRIAARLEQRARAAEVSKSLDKKPTIPGWRFIPRPGKRKAQR